MLHATSGACFDKTAIWSYVLLVYYCHEMAFVFNKAKLVIVVAVVIIMAVSFFNFDFNFPSLLCKKPIALCQTWANDNAY